MIWNVAGCLTDPDRKEALDHILLAIKYDAERGAYPEPHLDHAVMMLSSRDAGMEYMHTVIRGNVEHSPSEKTQTDSVSSYGREPVYLQCHHSDPR